MATLTLTLAATQAYQAIGTIASGEAPSSTELTEALAIANAMLDSWSSDPTMITQVSRTGSISLGSGTQSYTIGSGQTINITRPVTIVAAAFQNSQGPGGNVNVLNVKEWSSIPDRQRASYVIEGLYYDHGFTTGTVYITPVPQGSGLTLEIFYWAARSQFADTTTGLTMLPGDLELIPLALALRLAAKAGKDVPQATMNLYGDALARVQALNAKVFGELSDKQKQLIMAASGK